MFSLLSFLFSYPRISTRLNWLYQQWTRAYENLLHFFFSSNYRLLSCVLSNDPLYLKDFFFRKMENCLLFKKHNYWPTLILQSGRGGKAKKSDVRKTHSMSNVHRVSLLYWYAKILKKIQNKYISFSSSNTQFYESRILIFPI